MKIRYWLLAMSFIFLSCGRVADDVAANYGIIPMPNELAPMQGVYVLQGEKTVAVPSGEAAMKVFHYLTICILLSSNNSYLYVTSLFSSTLLHFSNKKDTFASQK